MEPPMRRGWAHHFAMLLSLDSTRQTLGGAVRYTGLSTDGGKRVAWAYGFPVGQRDLGGTRQPGLSLHGLGQPVVQPATTQCLSLPRAYFVTDVARKPPD